VRLSITRRGVQVTLGLLWLLDGLLQFQSYMYSHDFLEEVVESTASMQPGPIGHPILSAAHLAGQNLVLWNTSFALIQCAIGLGLLFRPTVKPALLASFAWVLVVWWFGEGLGMVLMNMGTPLTGSPGAVVLYGLIGLLVWPGDGADRRSAAASGLLGDRGGLAVWSGVWACGGLIWLEALTRPADAVSGALIEAAGDSMPWLAGLQRSLAATVEGDGRAIAVALALASFAVAAGAWTRWRRQALAVGALISLVFWFLGQGLGGLTTGEATDPNIGPLLVLLACALWPRRAWAATAASPARRRLTHIKPLVSRVINSAPPRRRLAVRGGVLGFAFATSKGRIPRPCHSRRSTRRMRHTTYDSGH
jgi:hypothetical protein